MSETPIVALEPPSPALDAPVVLVWSPDGGGRPLNRAAATWWDEVDPRGVTRGLDALDWRLPDGAPVARADRPWLRAAEREEWVWAEVLAVWRDGVEYPVRVDACPLSALGLSGCLVTLAPADSGAATGAVEDRAASRMGRVLERAGEEVYIFDAHTLEIIQTNRAARSAIGDRPPGRVHSILDVLVDPGAVGLRSLLGPLVEGEVERVRLPTVRRREDATVHPVEVALVPVAGEFPPLVAATVADLSARAPAEHRLRGRERHARRRANEHSAVRRVAVAVARGRNLSDICEMVGTEVRRMFGARAAGVVHFGGGMTNVVAASIAAGSEGVFVDHSTLEDGGLAARIFQSGAPEEGDGALAVPIQAGGVLWGALGVCGIDPDPERVPRAGRVGRLRRMAELLGIAVVGAEARSRMAELAATDHLTGLANRRAFHERLGQEVERARRHGRDLTLVLMDVDHFKQVNDQLGHQMGDTVLQEVARRLERLARRSDLVARLGGDEFAWLMPEGAGPSARQAAERARRAISGESLPGVGRLTISAGVCQLEEGMGGQELLRAADEALYRAKRRGRNVALVHGDGPVPVGQPLGAADLGRERLHQSLRSLARSVDERHPATVHHSERVGRVAARLARELGWPEHWAVALREAGQLQNVGALALSPSPAAPREGAEWARLRRHPLLSAEMVSQVLSPAQQGWIRGHHERWDGGGYPDGLARDRIPVGARLLALAEAWVAMTSERPWRPAHDPSAALAECRTGAGGQFWPPAVRALGNLVTAGRLEDPPA